jgi:MFS family permease
MVEEYVRAVRSFSRDARLLLATAALFDFTVFGGITPTLLNLYLLRLGYGTEFIGLLNATGALSVAAFCLPAGALGARWGPRRVIIAGSILLALGNGLLPLVNLVPGDWRSAWLLSMNAVGALGLALYVTNTSPFLMAAAGSLERDHLFSVQSAAGPLAAFAGSLIGGFLPGLFAALTGASLDQPEPFRYPLMIAAAMMIPSVFIMLSTTRPRDGRSGAAGLAAAESASAPAAAAPFRLIALLTLVIALQVAGEGIARTFFNVYLDAGLGVPAAQIGLLAGLGQLLSVPAALLTPVLMARLGYARAYLVSALGLAACLLPLALLPHWGAAGLGFMGVMMLAAIARTVITLFGMQLVAPAWRALVAGAMSMAVGLSWSIMSLGGGYVIGALGYASLFAGGALLSAAGAALFWVCFRAPRGEFARPAERPRRQTAG